MRNISFYECLNFRPAGASAIAFETAKVAYIVGATENKQLVQEARFSFDVRIHHSRCPSHITVPNYLFFLTARIFCLARVISLPSKHKNRATLRAVYKVWPGAGVAPV